MEVLLNDQSLDITLENEQTVGDVVSGVLQWLRNNSMAVTTVTVDEQPMPLAGDESISERSLDSVETIRLQAMTDEELTASAFVTIRDYFGMVHNAIENVDASMYRALAPQFADLRPILRQRLPEILDSEGQGGVELLTHYTESPPEGDVYTRLLSAVDRVARIADARVREMTDPRGELRNSSRVLAELLPELSEAPVLLQTGQEGDAMSLVYRFSELTSKVLRLLPRALPETEQQLGTEKLHGALSELLDAFESQDSVLIGDLIEYELVPKTESVLETIDTHTPGAAGAESSNGVTGDGNMG